MASNRFEAKAREAKVRRLFAVARMNLLTAVEVATDADLRDILVEVAGVNTPSDETWRQLVRRLIANEVPYIQEVA